MKKDGLVYSTNPNLKIETLDNSTQHQSQSIISVCFEKKGRKGKGVTIIKDFPGGPMELGLLSKKIKTSFGIGGSVKNNEIIVQGRWQEKVLEMLQKEGYKAKRVGG